MPIEDVDYLKQNSIVQSYIFLVDSKDRDHETYPTPSEYVTTFTAPFTNVIGLQLIDASIPRTMYNIDTYNNTISFYIHSYGTMSALYSNSNYKTIEIDTGNYTIQTLVSALTSALVMHVDDDTTKPFATITAETVSNPPELKNKIEFRCPYPFAFDMKNSTISEALGFDLFPSKTERYMYNKIDMPASQSNQQAFHSVNFTTSNSVYNSNSYSSFCNVLVQDFVHSNVGTVNITDTNYIAQRFTVPNKMYINSIGAAFSTYSVSPVPYSIYTGISSTPLYSSLVTSNYSSNINYPNYSTTVSTSIVQVGNLITSNITSNIVTRYTSNNTTVKTSNINYFANPTASISVSVTSNTNSITSNQTISVSGITIIGGYSNITSNVLNSITSNVTIGIASNITDISMPLVSSTFSISDVAGGLSTSTLQTPLITSNNSYYWLLIGSNTIGSGSNTGVYYSSNATGISTPVMLRTTNSGITWTPTINGSSSSNQLVSTIGGDLIYSSPVTSDEYNMFVGPRGVLRSLPVSSTQYVAQRFTASTRTFLKTVYAAFAYDSAYPVPFSITIGSETEPYISPDHTLFTSNMNIDFVNGTLSETSLSSPVLLLENVYYWLVFGGGSMSGSTAVYYNDINPYIGVHTLYSSANSGSTWTTPDVADINYQLSIQLTVADEYNRIEAPGIFNLIGEPYIVLRCPEIEQNSFRSLSFMRHSLGLAKINLGIVGYAEKRFDYSSVPTREFHPIGRFSRMTIRFETSSGKLYDFKGVNHTLTFAVRYYEPIQKKQFENSIINPNYDGDFLRYMYQKGDDNAEEDSVDEDEDYSRDNIENYRIIEARNTPERLEYEDREMDWYYSR